MNATLTGPIEVVDPPPAFPVASYAALLADKVVVLSDGGDYVALDRHFFQEALRPLIQRIRVDEDWYARTYPDIGAAVAKRAFASPREHYERFGYFEHRLPYPIGVEEEWYLKSNPDVREAIERRAFPSAQAHFERCGFREGRLPFPDFRLETAEA